MSKWMNVVINYIQSGWNPKIPTSGNVLPEHWYKADVGTYQAAAGAAAVADGDPVGQWQDQTANADHVVQAVLASKPTLKLNIKGGKPVLRFDGGDWLQGAFTTGGALTQPFTVFAMAQLDASVVNDGIDRILLDGDDAANRAVLFKDGPLVPDKWGIYAGAIFNGNVADSGWNIWTALFSGASSQFWHNGISEASGNAGAQSPDGITIGTNVTSTGFWKGDIAEIIIYAGNLSTADKNQVGKYLGTKYSIAYTDI